MPHIARLVQIASTHHTHVHCPSHILAKPLPSPFQALAKQARTRCRFFVRVHMRANLGVTASDLQEICRMCHCKSCHAWRTSSAIWISNELLAVRTLVIQNVDLHFRGGCVFLRPVLSTCHHSPQDWWTEIKGPGARRAHRRHRPCRCGRSPACQRTRSQRCASASCPEWLPAPRGESGKRGTSERTQAVAT